MGAVFLILGFGILWVPGYRHSNRAHAFAGLFIGMSIPLNILALIHSKKNKGE